ncbi:MAG TPA: DUF5801 repeats-in-toxin domain-containing protein, partial [Sphingorhabdus sp.]|nr:DUF5801 repeats-in-toxin domain-containing protein [Sphingorhabdus sp.]
LDDDALAGGNPGGTGDDTDAANVAGNLAASGGDGPLAWAYLTSGAPAGFSYVASGTGIDVFQGGTRVLAITLNSATGAYNVTQLAPIVHAAGNAENNQSFTLGYNVTDADGDVASGSLTINVDDDTPTAANDVDQILSGSALPATGNVITDAEGDGGADSVGADGGAAIVAVTGFGGAGTVGGVTNGQYGVLTINADGSYSYTRNGGTPGNVEDVFTYTLTDADGDTVTATLTISIEDARPVTGLNATVLLDDDALAGGNPGGTGDDADAANLTGNLAGSGGDGALTWAYQLTGAPAGFTYVANGTGINIFQGATQVLAVTLNAATGAYTVTQIAPITHAVVAGENNQGFTINYTVTDADGDSAAGTLSIDVDDDSPTMAGSATQPILAVDETVLATNATASFAGVFTASFGADGAAAANSITYALSVVAGPSGLVDTATGEAVNLVMNGAVVEGRTAVTNQLVFTVTVAANGDVTLDQIRAVVHNDPADPDEPGASAATIADNLVSLPATATDRDGDTASATVTIGQNLQ